MGMNSKPLVAQKELSSFFYENKLYEFSQKELSEVDRVKMKKMAETLPDAKYRIGSVLLSLEYLEQLSGVTLEIKDQDYENLGKRTRFQHGINITFFLILTLLLSVSGYYLIILLKGYIH